MSLEVLKAELLKDNVDYTAQQILDLEDSEYSSLAQVPRHVMTSLTTLCSAYGTLDDLVFIELGTNAAKTNKITLQMYQITDPQLLADDDFATKRLEVRIHVLLSKNKNDTAQWRLIRDIGLRLEYILEHRSRIKPNNTYMLEHYEWSADPDVTIDNTIDRNSRYKIEFCRSTVPTSTEQVHEIACEYTRAF